MNDTVAVKSEQARRLALWRGLSKEARCRWRSWCKERSDPEAWRPLVRAILDAGYMFPPTANETDMLWSLVDARPTDAGRWFTESDADLDGFREWHLTIGLLMARWDAFRDALPEDTNERSSEERRQEAARVLAAIRVRLE